MIKAEIEKKLMEFGLTPDNSIVIGSGILQALGIRESNDIDMVVSTDKFEELKKSSKFIVHETKFKKEVLKGDVFEIGRVWDVLGKKYELEDFSKESIVIDGVRYITLDFIYRAKKSWIKEGTSRPKDLNDLKLIEEYKRSQYVK